MFDRATTEEGSNEIQGLARAAAPLDEDEELLEPRLLEEAVALDPLPLDDDEALPEPVKPALPPMLLSLDPVVELEPLGLDAEPELPDTPGEVRSDDDEQAASAAVATTRVTGDLNRTTFSLLA